MVIVGAPYHDGFASANLAYDSGTAYVVFAHGGGFDSSLNFRTLDESKGFKIEGLQAIDYTGFSVSGAGDVNGDRHR